MQVDGLVNLETNDTYFVSPGSETSVSFGKNTLHPEKECPLHLDI